MSRLIFGTFLVFAYISGCTSKSEEKEHACVVESGVGAPYCLVDTDRSTCETHGLMLSHETVTYYQETDCRVAGFTQLCDDLDVYVTAEDECSDIQEEWALDGADGGAGGGQP